MVRYILFYSNALAGPCFMQDFRDNKQNLARIYFYHICLMLSSRDKLHLFFIMMV